MSRIKQLYSRIAPASKRQMKKIIEELQSLNSSLVQENQLLQAILEKNIDTMKKEISIARTEIGDVRDKIDEVETNLNILKDKLYVTEKHSYHAFLQAQEAVWALQRMLSGWNMLHLVREGGQLDINIFMYYIEP